MKKCIIIHGCPSDNENEKNLNTSTYDKHWIPWIKNELIKNNIETITPILPFAWNPDYIKFKTEFEKYVINKDTMLIGHSCGCAFLVRWLSESKKNISKLILVAPWKDSESKDINKKNFYTFDINSNISNNIDEIIIFTSDNEEEKGKTFIKIYNDFLGGKIINLKNQGHFTLGDMGTEKFPELLKEILK